MKTRAFVTGGSGFIGRALIRRLVEEGVEVLSLVRSDHAGAVVAALGASPVLGDLTDPSSWEHAIAGSEVVFHLAAETDVFAPRERHDLVTVEGTRTMVAAARRNGVRKFVHCGSEAALLAGEPLLDVDESAPVRPDSAGAYMAAKARAEQIVLTAASPGFETVSIRPRLVWGPESGLIEGLARAAQHHGFFWIGGGHHRSDVTYVDNAVEGMILGWRRGRGGEAYFVTDQHRVDLREFLTRLFSLYGVDEPIQELDAAEASRKVPLEFRWFFGQEVTVRTEKAVRELGYHPIVSQDIGVQRTAAQIAQRDS